MSSRGALPKVSQHNTGTFEMITSPDLSKDMTQLFASTPGSAKGGQPNNLDLARGCLPIYVQFWNSILAMLYRQRSQ